MRQLCEKARLKAKANRRPDPKIKAQQRYQVQEATNQGTSESQEASRTETEGPLSFSQSTGAAHVQAGAGSRVVSLLLLKVRSRERCVAARLRSFCLAITYICGCAGGDGGCWRQHGGVVTRFVAWDVGGLWAMGVGVGRESAVRSRRAGWLLFRPGFRYYGSGASVAVVV